MCAGNVFVKEHLVAVRTDGPTGMCWLLQRCSKALSLTEPARCPGWLSAPYPTIKEESTAGSTFLGSRGTPGALR